MRLYKDKVLLNQAVAAASRYFKADPAIVEKDYYASVLLKRLSGKLPELMLTGSTSLFKCYRVINRFSDDIDLTLTQDRDQITADRRKQVKKAIKEVCQDLGFSLLNEDDIKSRRDFNRYEIDYSPKSSAAAVKPVLHVDLSYPTKAFSYESLPAPSLTYESVPAPSPIYENLPVSSLIYEYMNQAGQGDFIRQYKLQPFSMSVRTMDRALADKIFDLCDSYLAGRISGQSYNIYDISRMLEYVPLGNGFADMFENVRAERKVSGSERYISADDACNIPGILSEILAGDVYKRDYCSVTANALADNVSYEEACSDIQKLIGSNN